MTERLSFSEGVQFAWDATSLTLFLECPRKYYYRMILNIIPQGETNVHLLFGGVYASALELFYRKRADGATVPEAQRAAVHHALIETWNKETGVPLTFNDPNKTRNTLIRSIVWYIEQFGYESDQTIQTYHLQDGRPAVELSFAVEISDDILWCGHLDRVVNYAGKLYWMDQKTTKSTIGPYFFQGFELSVQFKGYTWAGQTVLGEPFGGGIIDGAQIAAGFTQFGRSPITFFASQLDEWRDHTIWTIEAAREATRRQQFPMNPTSCGNYSGCQYRTLCTRNPTIRDHYISGDFRHPDQPWDPLRAR